MKTKQIQLSVPEPCHEDWNKMTPRDQGAFCQSCAKVVVDFTQMSDREIIAYLEKSKEQKICGKFSPYQLDRKIVATIPKANYLVQFKKFFTGLFFGLSFPALSKAAFPAKNNIVIVADDAEQNDETIIKGQVVSEAEEAIANASVRIYLAGRITQQFVLTDLEGKFEITIDKKYVKKGVSLKVSAPYFKEEMVEITSADALTIYLDFANKSHHGILGKMAIIDTEIAPSCENTDKINAKELAIKEELIAAEEFPASTQEVDEVMMGDVIMEELETEAVLKIRGKVVDQHGEPLPFAEVLLKNTALGSMTDMDGYFSIPISQSLQEMHHAVIAVRYFGYETIERDLAFGEEDLLVELVMNRPIHTAVLGAMVFVPVAEKSPTSFDANYQEPDWKEKGFSSRKEYKHHMKFNKKLTP